MASLRISLVSSLADNEYDDDIREIFTELLDLINKESSAQKYSQIDLIKFSYNEEPYVITKDTVASLTPAKYIDCKETMGDKITPLLAVKKNAQTAPYFPAFFIANKDSEIDSINSGKIKRIYLVSKTSTSGYITPLYKLWESGVLSTPNEKAIKEKNWEMILVGNQRDIEREIIDDKEAIGGTGQFTYQDDPEKRLVRPLLTYYNLPQDVIVVSNNLLPFQNSIIEWFRSVFNKDSTGNYLNKGGLILSQSSTKITGVYKIDTEFNNALNDLERMINKVNDFKERENGNSIPEKKTGKTIKIFLASSAELETDRKEFREFIGVENDRLNDEGIYLKIIQWEYFLDTISETRKQDDYNKEVITCDIFLSLFFTKVGKFSNEEFETAYGQFIKTDTPKVYTYFKHSEVDISKLNRLDFNSKLDFEEKLNAIGHFPSVYTDINDLKYQFKLQLEKILPGIIQPK